MLTNTRKLILGLTVFALSMVLVTGSAFAGNLSTLIQQEAENAGVTVDDQTAQQMEEQILSTGEVEGALQDIQESLSSTSDGGDYTDEETTQTSEEQTSEQDQTEQITETSDGEETLDESSSSEEELSTQEEETTSSRTDEQTSTSDNTTRSEATGTEDKTSQSEPQVSKKEKKAARSALEAIKENDGMAEQRSQLLEMTEDQLREKVRKGFKEMAKELKKIAKSGDQESVKMGRKGNINLSLESVNVGARGGPQASHPGKRKNKKGKSIGDIVRKQRKRRRKWLNSQPDEVRKTSRHRDKPGDRARAKAKWKEGSHKKRRRARAQEAKKEHAAKMRSKMQTREANQKSAYRKKQRAKNEIAEARAKSQSDEYARNKTRAENNFSDGGYADQGEGAAQARADAISNIKQQQGIGEDEQVKVNEGEDGSFSVTTREEQMLESTERVCDGGECHRVDSQRADQIRSDKEQMRAERGEAADAMSEQREAMEEQVRAQVSDQYQVEADEVETNFADDLDEFASEEEMMNAGVDQEWLSQQDERKSLLDKAVDVGTTAAKYGAFGPTGMAAGYTAEAMD